MWRAVSNSLLAALVVAALFWGNCLSCPQLLLSPHNPHSCCHRSAPVARVCTTQVLKHFVKADLVVVAPPAVGLPVNALSVLPAPREEFSFRYVILHSPPDFSALSCVRLI